MTETQSLPHWQLDSIFPGLESSHFDYAKSQVKKDVAALETFMDEQHIRSQESLTLSDDTVQLFETLTRQFNEIYTNFSDMQAYLYGFIATDAFNDEAQAEFSSLQPLGSRLSMLSKRFTAWLGSLAIEELLARSEVARAHRYMLEQSKIEASHLMGDEAEALISALDPTAGDAWSKLHGDLISRSSVRKVLPDKDETDYGLSELTNLQSDKDPALRRAAYEAELELLEQNAVSFAAAMNSIKGQVGELCKQRGWASALDEALFGSSISRQSLSAMQAACEASLPILRRYLKAKARFLGKDKLAWYDLNAPVSVGAAREYSWEEAKTFVVENFRGYSARLADFAEKAFELGWLDVPPRKGKTNGAFCMDIPGVKESRVMLNFGGTLDDIFTIAHELGHAYHNQCMYDFDRTLLQSKTPMTLAETASIFCETIVVNAILAQADAAERLAVLEQDLLGATGLIIDIHSRFIFESTIFARREERELSIEEMKAIMLDAQAATYGEGLDEDQRHPYMWAHKGHYYSAEQSFYNFPYTFGYLFGLGLYAQYQENPEGFAARYDELLASTGMDDAATLAQRFGIDIEDPAFWRGSLSIAEGRVAEFERLVKQFSA